MKVHELKTIQPHYDMVEFDQKTFELRFNDRDFNVGDILILQEYNNVNDTYSGDAIVVKVVGMLKEFPGLTSGWVILSIKKLN